MKKTTKTLWQNLKYVNKQGDNAQGWGEPNYSTDQMQFPRKVNKAVHEI